jgi:dipeptidyl aminopeptidase/acylaminoacyl peptidase
VQPVQLDDFARIVDVEDPRVSPDERWIAYVQRTVDRLENGYKSSIWLVATAGGAPVQLTRSGQDSQPRWSPDSRTLAFTSARGGKPQIYLIHIAEPGGEAYPLTAMPNGAAQAAWSPDGKTIAFLSPLDASERSQEVSGVAEPPPADKLEASQRRERLAQAEARRYDPLRAWRIPYRDGYGKTYLDGRYQQIYVIEAAAGAQPRRLTDLDADFSAPVWMPDGAHLLTVRPSEHLADEPSRFDAVYRIAVADGAVSLLSHEAYADRSPMPSADSTRIAYVRTPQDRLYTRVPRLAVMPSSGGPGRDLTLALDRTALDPRWSPDSQSILFRAHSEGSTEIYQIDPNSESIDKVVAAVPGDFIEVQAYDVSPRGGIVYAASTPTTPAEVFWLPAGASQARQLTQANSAFLAERFVQPVHEVRYPSYDGSTVQGWYILPVGYQSGQRYPLIVNIHGGPRIMYSPASKMWHEWQFLAAQGYVVFFCNAHGSDGYGQAYQQKSYGEVDLPDHLAGVDLLIERGLADPARMAVWGGSYGGYMTAWVVTHTDRFAAAIAERGVYNLLSHYGTTDFPMPTPQEFDNVNPWEDPMLMWKYSPLAYAHQIRTPLLLIHSENDYRVLISEAEQLFTYMRLSGSGPVEMLRFPREGHGLSRNGEPEHRIIRLQALLEWFDRYCKP